MEWTDETLRIVSARKADRKEQNDYSPERRSKIIALLPDLPHYTADEMARLEAMTDEEAFLNALADPDAQPSDKAKRDYVARRHAELSHERDLIGLTQPGVKGI